MMQYHFISLYIFFLGSCIGSFLNVCIYRLPESKSIVRPGSACPKCGTPIKFYDNIPILSYLWLRGKCRRCGSLISIRYPLVELLSGLFALSMFLKFGPSPEAVAYYLLICALLVITFIDIDHQIIPDVITLPGIPICFAATFALSTITYIDALIGILAGGGSLLAVEWAAAISNCWP